MFRVRVELVGLSRKGNAATNMNNVIGKLDDISII